MEPLLKLESLEQVRALADPLRLKILEALGHEPRTTKQVADGLGEKPTRLYHHVRVLEQAGLIRQVKTRRNRGTIEKYYEASAQQIGIEARLFQAEGAPDQALTTLGAIYGSILRSTAAEMEASLSAGLIRKQPGEQPIVMGHLRLKVRPERVRELHRRLREVMAEFQSADDKEGPVHYGLTVAFYPVVPESRVKRVEARRRK